MQEFLAVCFQGFKGDKFVSGLLAVTHIDKKDDTLTAERIKTTIVDEITDLALLHSRHKAMSERNERLYEELLANDREHPCVTATGRSFLQASFHVPQMVEATRANLHAYCLRQKLALVLLIGCNFS